MRGWVRRVGRRALRGTSGGVLVVAAVLLALVLAGCTRSLAADDIERELERRLSTQDFVPEVTCEDDLPGEVGSSITCDSVLADGLDVEITVTATHVDGDQVRYQFAVEPTGLDDGGGDSPPSTPPTNATPTTTPTESAPTRTTDSSAPDPAG